MKFVRLLAALAMFMIAGSSLAQAGLFGPKSTTPNQNFAMLAQGGKGGWLNVTRPLTVEDMQGRVVLLDFWTYGCINCMQITPDLEYLEQSFGERLLIIGVHSAKFANEKGNEQILAAAKRFGLHHPVINDSDYAIWNAFKIKAWPTQVLLDGQGNEIARFEGEGHRNDIAAAITKAISPDAAGYKAQDLVPKDAAGGALSFPARLALGPDKLIYVADAGHNRIVGIDTKGKIKVAIGSGQQGTMDGDFTKAAFNKPHGIAFLGPDLYVADTGNHEIRRIDFSSHVVETVAGTGEQGEDRDVKDAAAKATKLASPWDVEDMGDGKTLAIAMAGLHQIWSFDTKAQTLSVMTGTGDEDITDGPALSAALSQPSGLSRAGNILFFVDAETSSLRMIKDGNVKTLIGTGLFNFGLIDGQYPMAMMQHAQGLFADQNRVYVADTYNSVLRIYDRGSGNLSTVTLKSGKLNEPGDVLVVGGMAYVADTNDNAIKVVDLTKGKLRDLKVK